MSETEDEPRSAIIIIETEKREMVKGYPKSAQYIPCFVTDGETGYSLTSWLWGNDVNAAKARADEYNAKAGLTHDDVVKLVLQSMRSAQD